MNTTFLRLNAPIVPNEGLGGLALRTKLIDIQDFVFSAVVGREERYSLVSPFEARYRLGDGEIEISADVRNGKIFKITACQGYRGLLFGKISVGMLVREAMLLFPDLYYDEREEVIQSKYNAGFVLDVLERDPPPELVPDMSIGAISVIIDNFDSREANRGIW